MQKTKMATLGVVSAVGALALSGCSTSAASDVVYVHKGGGPFESKKAKGCVTPSSREISKPGDDYFAYPASQRVYAFTGAKGDDGAPFSVVSKDGQTLTVPGTLSFSLNIECDVLQKFHDKIGNRYQAYMDGDQTSDGWSKMLNIYMRPSLDATLDRIAKQYNWNELRSDPTIKDTINREVNEKVATLIDQQLDGDQKFFVNYSALIQQPIAPESLVASVRAAEEAKAKAAADTATAIANAASSTAKSKADAAAAQSAATVQVAQKTAELRVALLEAKIKKAEIDSYGGPQKYNDYLAIQKGLNPYQPTYGGQTLVQP